MDYLRGAGDSATISNTGLIQSTGAATQSYTTISSNSGTISLVNDNLNITNSFTNAGTIQTTGSGSQAYSNGVINNNIITAGSGGLTVSAGGVSGTGTFYWGKRSSKYNRECYS